MQINGKPIDRKDGFGGGADAVIKSLENRSKDAWADGGTGASPQTTLPSLCAQRSWNVV